MTALSVAFIGGLVIGAFIGAAVMALTCAAKQTNHSIVPDYPDEKKEQDHGYRNTPQDHHR